MLGLAGVAATWNIHRLRAVRPMIDRLVAVLGAFAILAVVIGASLVFTEVTECAFAASILACSSFDLVLVAATDLAVGLALITAWLRSDACQAPRVIAIPPTRRHRVLYQ
jgi:Flp pilus assembly protein CpaB